MPLTPDEYEQLVGAFTSAAQTAFLEWARTEVCPGDVTPGAPPAAWTAVLAVRAAWGGFLVLQSSAAPARELARRVLAEAGTEPDEDMTRDCLGELANVIAGQAKALLSGTPLAFNLTPPRVTPGATLPDLPGGEWRAVALGCELGEVWMRVGAK